MTRIEATALREDGLVLRPPVDTDAQAALRMLMDPDVVLWMPADVHDLDTAQGGAEGARSGMGIVSCRVAIKCRYQNEGTLRSAMVAGDGRRYDLHVHGRLGRDAG